MFLAKELDQAILSAYLLSRTVNIELGPQRFEIDPAERSIKVWWAE